MKEILQKYVLRDSKGFKLTSGKTRKCYFDAGRLYSNPNDMNLILNFLAARFRKLHDDPLIATIPNKSLGFMGGLNMYGYTCCYVLPQRKEHGVKEIIQGIEPKKLENRYTIVLDSTTTTGESIDNATRVLRDAGGVVDSAFVICDRGEGAYKKLKKIGIELHYLSSLRRCKFELNHREFF